MRMCARQADYFINVIPSKRFYSDREEVRVGCVQPALRMKVLLVFGTRPEAIKVAPIVRAGRQESSLDLRVCVTGQHQEILNQALDFFEIEPDWRLDVMRPNQDLSSLTSRILDA